jgi:hypothetical protein
MSPTTTAGHAEAGSPASFEEFWPHYVYAHRHPMNRALHYVGTTGAMGSLAAAAFTLNPAWLLLAPVVGYGPAWVGHFFFEKNAPATFSHPLWSLRGDFKMCVLALRGRMRDEVERVCGGDGHAAASGPHAAASSDSGQANGTTTATA